MARPSPGQQKTVERVMHEFKHGELEQRDGAPVENPKQAIAIALREAGASNQEDADTHRRNLAHAKRNERRGRTAQAAAEGKAATEGPSRAALYARRSAGPFRVARR